MDIQDWGHNHFWLALIFFIFTAFFATHVAYKLGYFKTLPSQPISFQKVRFWQIAGAFGTYVVVGLIYYPIISLLLPLINEAEKLSAWIQLSYIYFSALCVIGYTISLRKFGILELLFAHKGLSKQIKSFLKGCATWLLAYPWMYIVNLIADKWVHTFWPEGTLAEQSAVSYFKSTLTSPSLQALSMLAIIVFVPILEELLFRGFLQNFLKRFVGRWAALVLTAFIFAAVHYSATQGLSNVILISSLGVLSLFLGYLYEKEQTLVAPIGLHALFNATTVLFLSLQSS